MLPQKCKIFNMSDYEIGYIDQKFAILSVSSKKTAAGDVYHFVEMSSKSGLITGRVWPEFVAHVNLSPCQVFLITGVIDTYQQEKVLNIKSAIAQSDHVEDFLIPQPTLVFDIETIGQLFSTLDKSDQDYFLKSLEKDFKGTKRQLYGRTGLYPMYGSVLTIGLYNPHSRQGKVLYLSPQDQSYTIDNFTSQAFASEADLIQAFWNLATPYQRFVTYNGSGFDFPFLAFRSAIHRIKVPFDLNGPADKFVDLSYKFRINNRPFKLETICKSLGVKNPKLPGVSGMEVSKLFRQGKLEEIVQYVSRDVIATSELYDIWRKYLSGKLII